MEFIEKFYGGKDIKTTKIGEKEAVGLDYRKYKLNKREIKKYILLSYTGFFMVGYLFYKSLLIAAVIGFISWKFKPMYEEYLAKSRKDKLLMQFKDLMYGISSTIGNGGNMRDSLKSSRENMVRLYSDEGYIVKEIDYMISSFDNAKMYENDILYDFANRSDLEDIRGFIDVYVQCKMSGGNLQKIVMNTIEIIIEKMNIQREIKTIVAQKQMEGKIVAVMPIIILGFLNLVSPSYLSPMYDTAVGRVIMTISLSGFIFAIVWILQILNWR